MLGDTADIYLSAGLQVAHSDKWYFIPELLRTELSYYSGMFGFTFGRMQYTEPLGFIAEGLFDGAQLSLTGEAGTFSLGAWYTGFLYKRRANIAMTQEEVQAYAIPIDFDNFGNTYFAPRRFVAALGWQHLGWPVKTHLSVLGQTDLSGGNHFNSQYLIGRISIPGNVFSLEAGGAFAMMQHKGDSSSAIAAELVIGITLPTRIHDRILLLGRYSSGVGGGAFTAFEPITIKTQGEIFSAKLSGLSFATLDYFARLHSTFSLGLMASCFLRTDFETYKLYPLLNQSWNRRTNGHILGTEFFGRLLWSPYSDIQFNLGGGAFLPSLGDAATEAVNSWRVELNVIIYLR